jgi:LacI family transcriptional regulator
MNSQQSKIRIKDIARLAGVSEGTVDRVLHNRGEVSKKSMEAVNKVLEEINYSPNLLARSLASKKHFKLICLIPGHLSTDYWESIEKGLDQAAGEFIHYNIHLKKYFFDQFDVNSYLKVTESLNFKEIDGFIIAPIFRAETLNLSLKLDELKIPYSFIDSMVEEADFLTYYGQNSFQSGYVAAKLLLNSLTDNSRVIVVRTKRKGAVSNQTLGRINGFMDYITKQNLNNISLIHVELSDTDEKFNRELIRKIFQENTNIKGMITFNSKVYRLVKYLDEINQADIKIIGYDLLQQSIEFLKQDKISYLIGQRPEKQSYLTVRDMCTAIIFKQEVKKICYVPIDILMKENINDYTYFNE